MLVWVSSPPPRNRRFVLLDRDGVINVDRHDYIKRWDEVVLYTEALQALKRLNDKGFSTVLISNQSALGRGFMRWEDFTDIHFRMVRKVREAGGEIHAAFFCPHQPDDKCTCRKPAPGMILAAARLFQFDLSDTVFIGNRMTDVQTAENAGCRGILITRESDDALENPQPLPPARSDVPSHVTLSDAIRGLIDS